MYLCLTISLVKFIINVQSFFLQIRKLMTYSWKKIVLDSNIATQKLINFVLH